MALARQKAERQGLHTSTSRGDTIFGGLTRFFAAVVIAAAVTLAVSIVAQAWPALQRVGLSVFGGVAWNPSTGYFGGLSFIYGTFVTSLLALLFAGVIGVMVAVFLVELAPPFLARPVSFLIEMLAAVPSIIFGLWGIFVLIPLMIPVEGWLNTYLGWIPIFSGAPSGRSYLTAAIVLTIMILPTVAALSRDVMNAVPGSQREGMLALGATKWEVVRDVVIPYARAGIIGALILALGRAIGETMAVTMVIGNTQQISASLLAPGYSLAAVLATESGEAFASPIWIGALFELGLLLLLISVLLNVVARVLVWRINRGSALAVRG